MEYTIMESLDEDEDSKLFEPNKVVEKEIEGFCADF